jgi:hypothetical protein
MNRHRLSENHRRTISSTLSILDETLGVFLRWTAGREERSVLYRENNDLVAAERQAINAEVEAMRSLIRGMRDDLDLEERVHDARRDIQARAGMSWESLCELDAKHLKGYGDVPTELIEYLGPRVGELIERLNRIRGTAEGGAPPT